MRRLRPVAIAIEKKGENGAYWFDPLSSQTPPSFRLCPALPAAAAAETKAPLPSTYVSVCVYMLRAYRYITALISWRMVYSGRHCRSSSSHLEATSLRPCVFFYYYFFFTPSRMEDGVKAPFFLVASSPLIIVVRSEGKRPSACS